MLSLWWYHPCLQQCFLFNSQVFIISMTLIRSVWFSYNHNKWGQGCPLMKMVVGAGAISAGEYQGNIEFNRGDKIFWRWLVVLFLQLKRLKCPSCDESRSWWASQRKSCDLNDRQARSNFSADALPLPVPAARDMAEPDRARKRMNRTWNKAGQIGANSQGEPANADLSQNRHHRAVQNMLFRATVKTR